MRSRTTCGGRGRPRRASSSPASTRTSSDEAHGNPIELLSRVPQSRLDELGTRTTPSWRTSRHRTPLWRSTSRARAGSRRPSRRPAEAKIAYFSMEYGLHESLPIYSGGLGVLAGDHLKTASDLGLPLVGVGLAYAEGYFRQVLADDGLQAERYPINDWHRLPVQPVFGRHGQAAHRPRGLPRSRRRRAAVAGAGRARAACTLLDANLEQNTPGRSRHHRPALRRRPGVPRPAGDHARHRRACTRSSRSGSRPRYVT